MLPFATILLFRAFDFPLRIPRLSRRRSDSKHQSPPHEYSASEASSTLNPAGYVA